MNNEQVATTIAPETTMSSGRGDFAATALVVLMALTLFYLPSILTIFSQVSQPHRFMIMGIIMATVYAAIFCLNYFWLVPRTLFRDDRKAVYFVINTTLILLTCILVPIWFEAHGGIPRPPRHGTHVELSEQYLMGYLRFVLRDGTMMVLSAALAYAMRLTRERDMIRRRHLELDAERRRLELRSLRAQLNPHFLFNSLNNIYALIAISPDNAQAALHDLSGMLRFMIYDASAPSVPLEKELRFISDYVALMRLRLRSSMTLTCDINTHCTGTPVIAPMLLLTLVENAFKHSAPDGAKGFIDISINADDTWLTCSLSNTCAPIAFNSATNPSTTPHFSHNSTHLSHPSPDSNPTSSPGIGLTNIRRQLNLLYPDAFSLKTGRDGAVYRAELRIATHALHL